MRGFREAHYVWAVGFLGKKKSGAVLYACGADDRTVPEWNSGGLAPWCGAKEKADAGNKEKTSPG